MWIDQQKANWRTVPRWRAKQKHDDSHLQPEMYLFCCGQWGMSNKSFLEQVCRSALCYKTCFYFIFACAYTLRLLFLFEVTLCSAGFFTPFCRVPCPVWRYYWHLWMPLFIHKWLLTVGAISNAALQNSSVPQKGVFPLSYVLCELPGISVGTDLNLHCAVCNYVPNRQKLNFSMKALAWRIKHSPFSCCLSFLLFNFPLSVDWNVSITLFYFTCVQGLAEIIILDVKSKPWSHSPRRWQFWHVWRVQSSEATFFVLVKRRTCADSVELCSFTQRK